MMLLLGPPNAPTREEPTKNEFKVGDVVYVPSLNLTGVVNEIRSRTRVEVLWQTGVMNQYSVDIKILKKVEQ